MPNRYLESILKAFHKEYPNINVSVQTLTWKEGFEKIVMAIAAGKAPDMLELGSTWCSRFIADGVLLDITEWTKPIYNQYLMWEPVEVKGRIYGLPWLVGSRIIFYNRDLFKQAGLDNSKAPETWSEMKNAVQKIASLGEDIYGYGIDSGEKIILFKKFLPYVWSNGGTVLSEDGKQCLINAPEAREALDFLLSLKPYSIKDTRDMIDKLFHQGKVGIILAGGQHFRTIPEFAPHLNYGVGLVPRPNKKSGKHISFAGGEMLVILKSSKHPEACWKLIQFLAKNASALEIAKAAKDIFPAARSAINDPYYANHPEQLTMLKQLQSAKAPPHHPHWVEMEDIIAAAVEKAMYGTTAQEALNEAKEKIDKLLK